jgi:hypothetical protein
LELVVVGQIRGLRGVTQDKLLNLLNNPQLLRQKEFLRQKEIPLPIKTMTNLLRVLPLPIKTMTNLLRVLPPKVKAVKAVKVVRANPKALSITQ